jgi:hypothetical protein
MLCMAQVFFATSATLASMATAWIGQYLAAMLVAFLASILWQSAYHDGRESARLYREAQ